MKKSGNRRASVLSRCLEPLENRLLLTVNHLVFITQPTDTVAGSTIDPGVAVAIEDSSNAIVTSDTSGVTLAIKGSTGPNGATAGGTLTVAAVNGIATFSDLTFTAAGTGASAYKLTATDASLTSANSASFSILPAAASKVVFNQAPQNVAAGATMGSAMTVDVEDQYGNVVTTDGSHVMLSIATGPTGATAGGTLTAAADSGVATFDDLTLETAGAYTIKASDGKLTSATSASFTVSANSAAQLAFAKDPAAAVAGVAMSDFTVQVQDAYGNLVATDTSDVTVAIGSGPAGATLSGTKKVTAIAGVSTLTGLSLQKAGTYTISATDGSLTAVTSDSFIISPAAASQVVITNDASDAAAGVSVGAVTVAVEDQFGNVVTTDKSKVTAAIAAGTGPNGAKMTGTAIITASKGIATFGNLSFKTAGSYKLTFTDGSLTSDTSASAFTISAAAAAKLAFGQAPTDTVAGVAINPAVTVQVQDAFGNVVTTDSSAVTVAIGTTPTGGPTGALATFKASSGVATFSKLKLNMVGAYTLKATRGKLSVTSASFKITPAAAAKVVLTTNPKATIAGSKINSIILQVQDKFGNVVTSDTSNVTMAITAGTGPAGATLGGTATVAAVKGVATFSTLTIQTVGTYRLSATDASLTGTTTPSFGITPAAASKLIVTQDAAAVTAGSTFGTPIKIAVEDKYGNVVTSNKSVVSVAIGGPTKAIMGGTAKATAASGIATFSDLAPKTAGSNTLTFTDGALTKTTSSAFVVSPAAAAKLAFGTAPAKAVAGVNLTAFTVNVEDQYGNVVTGDTSDVTIGIATGPTGAAITGTKKVTAIAGVSTFSAFALQTAGDYTVTATDGSLTSATSASFTITPAAASQLVIKQDASAAAAGAAISPAITIQVEDQFGNVVTTDTSKVTAAIAAGTGPAGATLSGTTQVAAVKGVSTFSTLKLTAAGSYKLTFTDGTLTSDTSASAFTISPAAAAKLAYGQAPTGTTTGTSISPSVTVKVEDQFGNVVTGDSSNVVIAVGTGVAGANLTGTLTQAASSGVATFNNLKLDKAGAYTLKATDGALTSITSPSFTMTAAPAAKLAITQDGTSAVAGANISPSIKVQIQDANGNLVSTDTSVVTVAIAAGTGPNGATLGGTLTATAVGGVATFSNLSLTAAGTYKLTFTDGSLTAATSASTFAITAAAASKLVIGQAPTATTTATNISPSVTVKVEDQYGNVVTTDTSNVTFAIATGPNGAVLSGTLMQAASAGIATFDDLQLDTAGSYTLTATDGSLTSVTSASFTIS